MRWPWIRNGLHGWILSHDGSILGRYFIDPIVGYVRKGISLLKSSHGVVKSVKARVNVPGIIPECSEAKL